MKNYKIAVAGTGYVGLSLSVLLAQHNQVMAVDIVQAKVDMINNHAPQWVRGIMVPYAAEEKTVEPTLQPLPLDAANEYNALKERYPDALVGYEQYGNFEFYSSGCPQGSPL